MSEPPSVEATPQPPVGQSCYRHADRETYIRCQRCDRPICPDCMRDAAVGFHCPTCVSEAAKTSRSTRTSFGGVQRDNPALTSMVLIGINITVWLAIVASGSNQSRLLDLFAIKLGGFCRGNTQLAEAVCKSAGASWSDGVDTGAYWQVVTSVFTHVDLLHIAFNMFALYLLGPQLEAMIGRARFLALYLLSGVGGSLVVLWLSNPYSATVGASGAIFGLMAALLVVIRKRGGNPQPILMWILINVAITFSARGISWEGHLGGFVAGLITSLILVYAPREQRTPIQIVGLSALAAVMIAGVVLRTATF